MIILVGPPGSGAHEIVAVLEQRGRTVVDSDRLVEEREGMLLASLAISGGPEKYAEAERAAAIAALDSGADIVVLGSGALGNAAGDERGAEVRERVDKALAEGAKKVYLTASAKKLLDRSGLNVPRSVAIGSPRSMYLTQLKARSSLYEGDALEIDTSEEDWEALADQIDAL
ncbi:shikimate kinase [Flaviflexus huanghaiensis]|uniref:shikimate kinase n=1 Tax=Flaviflexus huanghaiensis TaxID=1111473 RepID=UPI0015FC4662|nr:shikimate kinase [Flaviflexus huanghaiensis]